MAELISAEEVARQSARSPKPPQTKPVGERPLEKVPEEGMEIFGTDPTILKLAIGEVLIQPMNMGQIRRFLNEAATLIPLGVEMLKNGDELNITQLLRLDHNAVMRGIAIACNSDPDAKNPLTVKQIDSLLPDEFVVLVTKVVVKNFDFFVRALPKMAELVRKAALQVKQSGGASRSSDSSAQDIG